MPKVVVNAAKGLVQSTGNAIAGTQLQGVNANGYHFSQADESGNGFHRWVETIDVSAQVDNDICGIASVYIPAQARILFATTMGAELATSADASVSLQVHSAALALDAVGTGATEIVGADEAGNLSLPDTDLNVGSGDVLYDQITMGTLAPIDRGTAATHLTLLAKENMSAMTGTPKVTIVVEWIGRDPVAV